MIDDIPSRIQQIRGEIPTHVKLIAVTKYTTPDVMRLAYHSGIRDFGESRVQAAIAKMKQLQDLPDITWHLIGSLQSNKAKLALLHFDWIHSVDRLSLLQQLNQLAIARTINICLQVKLAPDPNKAGWSETDLLDNLDAVAACDRLKIRGLMSILPLGLSEEASLDIFHRVKRLQQQLHGLGWHDLTELSMGMSGDYDKAIAAGATMIRIGSKIFS